ncbi:glycosyltransferase family 2 protein [Celeribacter neptunius]|nr:glycosyltransferase family A protein [Celeribacter neptunius]
MTKISVIIPAYNAEDFIEECLQSVVQQNESDLQICIVDDGSTDATFDLLRHWASADQRIELASHTSPKGAAAARNRGIEMAQGDYIAFLDADDLWLPEKLSMQLIHMDEAESAFSCTAYELCDAKGMRIGRRQVPKEVDFSRLLNNNTIGTSTVMLRRAFLSKHRFPDLALRQDFALWLQLLSGAATCSGLNTTLTRYRRHGASLSANKLKAAKATWQVYKSLPSLSRRRALQSYANYLVRTTYKAFSSHFY